MTLNTGYSHVPSNPLKKKSKKDSSEQVNEEKRRKVERHENVIDKKYVLDLLKKYGISSLSRRLGQNFLIDPLILERQVSLGRINPDDTLLEIGAGLGVLTRELAKKAGKVYAFEPDRKLLFALRNELSSFPNIEIIPEDAVKHPFPTFNKCVSNLPYSVSSPIMFKLLKHDFEFGILMLQREFAERLVSNPGSSNYSRLTVSTALQAKVKIIDIVPRSAFYPQPKVDSALVLVKPLEKPVEKTSSEAFVDSLLRALFNRKSRKISKVLRTHLEKRFEKNFVKNLASNLPYTEERVRNLSPRQFIELADSLTRALEEAHLAWFDAFSGTKTSK